MIEPVLFVGPSGHGLDLAELTKGMRVLPPARRGDVQDLVEREELPGIIVLADGVFQIAPAVSHAEICLALDRNWEVWGVSSMGAIRAYEMRSLGMKGFGKVYQMFIANPDLPDDEVCLEFFPESPFFPVSVPLVNVRHSLENLTFKISTTVAVDLVRQLRELWFADRTIHRIRKILELTPLSLEVVNELIQSIVEIPVKNDDLRRLLIERPWTQGQ